jgi:hypothetical protein
VQTILYHLTQPVPLLPPELRPYQGLLARMIAKDPEDRFSSTAELLNAVQTASQQPGAGTTSIDRPLWSSGRFRRFERRGLRVLAAMKGMHQPIAGRSVATGVALAGAAAVLSGMAAFSVHGTGDASVMIGGTSPVASSSHFSPAISAATASASRLIDDGAAIPYLSKSRGMEVLVRRTLESMPPHGRQASAAPPTPDPATDDALAVTLQSGESLPAPQDPAESGRLLIDGWLAQAEVAMEAYRLTVPAGSSAYSYYSRVLEKDPRNAGALHGLSRIADTYAVLAQSRLEERNHDKAAVYVERGLAIRPRHARLAKLAAEIESASQTVVPAAPRPPEDPVTRFFERVGAFVTHPSNKPATDLLNH